MVRKPSFGTTKTLSQILTSAHSSSVTMGKFFCDALCLENPMDRGAWKAAVHGITEGQTRLTSLSLFTFMHWRRKWQPTPVFLPGESQGRGSLVGCHLWGRAESDTTEVT